MNGSARIRSRGVRRRASTAIEVVLSLFVLSIVGFVMFEYCLLACAAYIDQVFCLVSWPLL